MSRACTHMKDSLLQAALPPHWAWWTMHSESLLAQQGSSLWIALIRPIWKWSLSNAFDTGSPS
eukprot:3074353-Amphidinium_carterae.2